MQMPALVPVLRVCAVAAAMFIAAAGAASAQLLSGSELVAVLKQGGYVIVMRHANSPQVRPDPAIVALGNTRGERQLNENGHKTARAMGQALKALSVPIGAVLASPTFRTMETVRDLDVGSANTFNLLGDGSEGYEYSSFEDSARFIRIRITEMPSAGTNTLIVTHVPNMEQAFGDSYSIDEGEAVIVKPDDTLASIAARTDTPAWVIGQVNKVTQDEPLRPGQRLLVPQIAFSAANPAAGAMKPVLR
jgi:phosphohistidine phosphatase SixA